MATIERKKTFSVDTTAQGGRKFGSKKKESVCKFFDNQVFMNKELDFGGQTFYNDGWINSVQQEVEKITQAQKAQIWIVEKLETYEPKVIALEAQQTIELNQEKESDDIVHDKNFEFFKRLFDENEDEELKLNKYQFAVFEKMECMRHRNKIEVFLCDQDYYIVGKTFYHKAGDTRLVMSIHKYEVADEDEKGTIQLVHEAKQPIVSNFVCFDSSMISVIQFQKCLYYFKVVNDFDDTTGQPIKVELVLYKFDMEEEEELYVKTYEIIESTSQDQEELKYALAVVFVQQNVRAETEEEFLDAQYIVLLNESGKFNDQEYVYKIKKLSDFDQDLFVEEDPQSCNIRFNFALVSGKEIGKDSGEFIVLIRQNYIHIIPLNSEDDSKEERNIRYKDEMHTVDCRCCIREEREFAINVQIKYRDFFEVLKSSVYQDYEYLSKQNIVSKDHMIEIIKYLLDEGEKETVIDEIDSITAILDKSQQKYLLIFNLQFDVDKDEIIIIESKKIESIKLSTGFDAEKLHPITRVCHRSQKKFKRQKQLCQHYSNVVIETQIQLDVQSISISFNDPQSKDLWRTVDDHKLFLKEFEMNNLIEGVQFVQLAEDDRKILPRIWRDEEEQEFYFQMYDYSNLEVVHQVLIDLSSASFNFEETLDFISPCTSVYSNYGSFGKQFCQNFQVLIYPKNKQLLRIFEIRAIWSPTRVNSKPFVCSSTLIGLKYLICKPDISNENSGLYPLFDDKLMIRGTQFVQNNKVIVTMQNMAQDDIQFANEFSQTYFTIYYNEDTHSNDHILVGAQVTEAFLSKKDKFTDYEFITFLKLLMRSLLNMIPYDMLSDLAQPFNETNFLQPLEIIGGQSLCDYKITDSSYIHEKISVIKQTERNKHSLLVNFLSEQSQESQDAFFEEDNFLPFEDEISTDMFCNNAFQRCFEGDNILELTVERFLSYMFTEKRNKYYQMILLNLMPQLLTLQETSIEYGKFFIDSPEAEINEECPSTRFTWMIEDEDLPKLSLDSIAFRKYDDSRYNARFHVEYFVKEDINSNMYSQEIANIPVNHFYVDLRSQILPKKLMQFSYDQEITSNDPNETDLSNYLWEVCMKYNDNIEFQSSIRNLIDSLYVKTKKIYTFQFAFFLFFYIVPLLLQIFVVETESGVTICNQLCMITTIVFFLHAIIQFLHLGEKYFHSSFNYFEIAMFFMYSIYFFIRQSNKQSFLPVISEQVTESKVFEAQNQDQKNAINGFFGDQSNKDFTMSQQVSDTINDFYGIKTDFGVDEEPFVLQQSHLDMIDNFYGIKTTFKPGSQYHEEENTELIFTIMVLLHLILLILAAIKCIYFIRVYEVFSEIIWLMSHCIIKIIPITFLFYCWIIVFSILFRILGMEANNDDYPMLGSFVIFGAQTYRNAVGDIQPPMYSFWERKFDEDNGIALPYSMVSLIWMFWFLNQFFVFIFFLNFLIAQISQAYEEMISKSLVERYVYRCNMNRECRVMLSSFRMVENINIFIISADCTMERLAQNWQGFVQTLKNFIKVENNNLIDKIEEQIKESNAQVMGNISTLESKLEAVNGKVIYISEVMESKLEDLAYNLKQITSIVDEIKEQNEDNKTDRSRTRPPSSKRKHMSAIRPSSGMRALPPPTRVMTGKPSVSQLILPNNNSDR